MYPPPYLDKKPTGPIALSVTMIVFSLPETPAMTSVRRIQETFGTRRPLHRYESPLTADGTMNVAAGGENGKAKTHADVSGRRKSATQMTKSCTPDHTCRTEQLIDTYLK